MGPAARMDGRVVDALACRADEGRGDAAKCLGERLPRDEPRVPEWSNPAAGGRSPAAESIGSLGGTGGSETSEYPEEQRGCPE